MSVSEVVHEVNNALLEALAAEIIAEVGPDEVTANMLATRAHINSKTAKNILEGKVKDGLMLARQARQNGHFVTAYRLKA